jgi:hypothetical protein
MEEVVAEPKVKKIRISRKDRKIRREALAEAKRLEKEKLAKEKEEARELKKKTYEAELQRAKNEEILYGLKVGTLQRGVKANYRPKRVRYTALRNDQCHQCFRAHKPYRRICDKVFYCEQCIEDFYPDMKEDVCPHCQGTCRCNLCHPTPNQYLWYKEVVKAHFTTYRGDKDFVHGEWLYDLISAMLKVVDTMDNQDLVGQPPDPFAMLHKVVSGGMERKIASAWKGRLRRAKMTNSCHLCHHQEENTVKCSNPGCGLIYCIRKLHEDYDFLYGAGFDFENEFFECPRCQDACDCPKCRLKIAAYKLMTEGKTMRQWMFYYLYGVHQHSQNRVLYDVLRKILPSGKCVSKIANLLLLMYATAQ